MKTRYLIIWVSPMIIAAMILSIIGCGSADGRLLGVSIPQEKPVIALSDVLNSPSKYDGKSFVMKGIISGQCAALCDFTFRDGNETAVIYPQGFKTPKMPVSQKVTLFAQATTGPEKVVLSVLGMELE